MENQNEENSLIDNRDFYVIAKGDVVIREFGDCDPDVQSHAPYIIYSDSNATYSQKIHITSEDVINVVRRLVREQLHPRACVQIHMRTTDTEDGVYDMNILVACDEKPQNQPLTIHFYVKCCRILPTSCETYWKASASKYDENAFAILKIPPEFSSHIKEGVEVLGAGVPGRLLHQDGSYIPGINVTALYACLYKNELRVFPVADMPFPCNPGR